MMNRYLNPDKIADILQELAITAAGRPDSLEHPNSPILSRVEAE